jgi:hypothetical protein
MSRDRVHFKLPYSCGSRDVFVLEAAIYAFGLSRAEASTTMRNGLTLVCRPSQFARFLIKRDELGGTNDFKGLKAVLVPAPLEKTEIDVSKREHNL